MSILLVGLSYKTAPVALREQLAFTRSGVADALLQFRNRFPHCEAAILSTCNRVEVLVASDSNIPTAADIVSFLAEARDLPVDQFRQCLYQLSGEQACRHLFRVVSGLDSMVLGEAQIVAQVKEAYAHASEQGTTGRVLNRIFYHAFAVSKRIRTETSIGEGRTSIPSVAVNLAQSIFDDLSAKQTLVVGAGKMAQLLCQYLHDAGGRRFVITTRTLASAAALAESVQATAVPYDQLEEQLAHADIVVTATSCPFHLLTVDRVREAQRRRRGRHLFLIDLAVPRNIDPAVGALEQVYLYDVDALGRIVATNQQRRSGQLEACERILDEEVVAFETWLEQSRLNPIIRQMVDEARLMAEAELERVFNRCPDMTDTQRQAVELLAERMIGKLLHPRISALRGQTATPPAAPSPAARPRAARRS